MRRAIVLLLVLLAASCYASDRVLVVGVHSFPPCVDVGKDGACKGFDIDVLDEVAKSAGLSYRLVPVTHFKDVFDGLESGRFDLAMCGITITEEREKRVDFSHPYLDSGLRMLVRAESTANTNKLLWGVAIKVFQSVRWLLLLTFLIAHVVWFLERGENDFDAHYLKGILQASYWAVVTMSTVGYGDYAPRHPIGRVCTMFVILIGVMTFGFVVAQVTTAVTTQAAAGAVAKPEDLRDKPVGVKKDTTSVDTVVGLGAKVKQYDDFDAACAGLLKHEVDVVVCDSPVVVGRAKDDTNVKAAGEMFAPQKYGIALRDHSPLREPINRAILKLMESDRYKYLQTKWFGPPEGG